MIDDGNDESRNCDNVGVEYYVVVDDDNRDFV